MNRHTDILDEFVKEFDDSDPWYDTNDYWKMGEHTPPFDTDTELLSKVVNKILSLNRPEFGEEFPSEVTKKNIKEVFEQCNRFVEWWNETVRKEITKAVKKGIKDKTLKSEDDARAIALISLTDTITSYVVTGYISNLLPKTLKTEFSRNKYTHPWFRGKMTCILYEDIWGRIWSKSWGLIQPDVKLYTKSPDYMWINELGGMMWNSTTGKRFTCEYRTSKPEHENQTRPETFIG